VLNPCKNLNVNDFKLKELKINIIFIWIIFFLESSFQRHTIGILAIFHKKKFFTENAMKWQKINK